MLILFKVPPACTTASAKFKNCFKLLEFQFQDEPDLLLPFV